ncbi:hypothetical protein PUN28_000829 [Cardiocondyla obscurior]|uniref:Uncharacterized protein n=1 Tax=Cardiocondyla obscurior TaxID=286306 RepID=A0AAW2H1T6_9HYME
MHQKFLTTPVVFKENIKSMYNRQSASIISYQRRHREHFQRIRTGLNVLNVCKSQRSLVREIRSATRSLTCA